MASVSVYNMEGKETGKMELNDSIFAAPVNEHLVHRAVVLQLANKRQGTQKAKTRSEVRGGGRKPWREPDMQDRVRSVLHSGRAAELYLLLHREIIHLR